MLANMASPKNRSCVLTREIFCQIKHLNQDVLSPDFFIPRILLGKTMKKQTPWEIPWKGTI